jgi:hypothetical protein
MSSKIPLPFREGLGEGSAWREEKLDVLSSE